MENAENESGDRTFEFGKIIWDSHTEILRLRAMMEKCISLQVSIIARLDGKPNDKEYMQGKMDSINEEIQENFVEMYKATIETGNPTE